MADDSIDEIKSTRLHFGMLLEPTLHLRWGKSGRLQQAWVDRQSGHVSWQDVPTEDAASAAQPERGGE